MLQRQPNQRCSIYNQSSLGTTHKSFYYQGVDPSHEFFTRDLADPAGFSPAKQRRNSLPSGIHASSDYVGSQALMRGGSARTFQHDH